MPKEKQEPGFGDSFEYKGKIYQYVKEIKVRVNTKEKWITYVQYYNNTGTYAREKTEFFKLFTPRQK